VIELRGYVDEQGNKPFAKWLDALDHLAAAKVTIALVRIEQGNLSNREPPWRASARPPRCMKIGGLDTLGKMKADPQRIRGRSSVGAFQSPSVNLVWTQLLEPRNVVSAARRMNTCRNVFYLQGVLRSAVEGA
jgi:hypothetical protein